MVMVINFDSYGLRKIFYFQGSLEDEFEINRCYYDYVFFVLFDLVYIEFVVLFYFVFIY